MSESTSTTTTTTTTTTTATPTVATTTTTTASTSTVPATDASSTPTAAAAAVVVEGSSPVIVVEKQKKTKNESSPTTAATAPLSTMIETQSVKGTRDWPPEVMRERNWLFGMFRTIARRFAFEEYDAPIIEEEQLYKRKAGEEISEQIYNFVTKDDTKVTLRPEMTPSLARLVLQKGKAMILPARWFTVCQCWRFEAIQKGRKREHYQWNMDIIGSKYVTAEAELVAAAIEFCQLAGLTQRDVLIKVNSRKILQSVLAKHGVVGDVFGQVCVVVDKLDKLPVEEVHQELLRLGLSLTTAEAITGVMQRGSLDEIRAELGAEDPNVLELTQFFDAIDAYGLSEWVQFSPSVVRGLVYYTGIVFEGFDRRQKSRAIFGGGRYDELLTKFGSPTPVPCCGFGFGDCVIMDVLRERKKIPEFPSAVEDLVIPFNESMRLQAIKVVQKLRSTGRQVDIMLDARRIKNAFSYADRVGAQRAIFVAPDEWATGHVRVKDLRRNNKEEEGGDAKQKKKMQNAPPQEKTDSDNGAIVLFEDLH